MTAADLADHLCRVLGVSYVAVGRHIDHRSGEQLAWVAVECRKPWLSDSPRWRCIAVGKSGDELLRMAEQYGEKQERRQWRRMAA